MKLTKIIPLGFGALFALGGASAIAQQKLSDDVVKIGVLTDMTGVYADIAGKGAELAAKMAVADFGGKMFGKPITVITADHQNKADIGSSIAARWFDADKVDMVTEMVNSGVALAVQAIGKQKNKIVINTGAATARLTNEECSPGTGIHYVYDTWMLANGTAKAVVKQGGDTWFFITADYAFGYSLEKDTADVVKANGGKVLGSVRHPLNASDFSSFLLSAQASKAKIIGLANAGGDAINTIKGAHEFGITKNQSLVGLLIHITDMHSLGLNLSQGLRLTTGWYWDLNEDTRKWSKRFFDKHGAMPGMIQAGTYSATLHYLRAVQAAGTDEAGAVMKKMKQIKINDMFAKGGYIREDGRMVHDVYQAQVKKPAESKYPWDYWHIRATIPGDQAFKPLAQSACPALKK